MILDLADKLGIIGKKLVVLCPKCGKSRWKTKIKRKEYECRSCGYIKKEGNDGKEQI